MGCSLDYTKNTYFSEAAGCVFSFKFLLLVLGFNFAYEAIVALPALGHQMVNKLLIFPRFYNSNQISR